MQDKKKMGPPFKAAEKKQSKVALVYLTIDNHRRLKETAKKAGESISEFLAKRALEACE